LFVYNMKNNRILKPSSIGLRTAEKLQFSSVPTTPPHNKQT
jgi:hypothetical protein